MRQVFISAPSIGFRRRLADVSADLVLLLCGSASHAYIAIRIENIDDAELPSFTQP
jgi:hypothetical protein